MIEMLRPNEDWSRQITKDVDPTSKRFQRLQTDHGYREACTWLIRLP
jgi:hypothetical protein